MKLVLILIFGIVAIRGLLTLGDFGYGKRVEKRYARWNSTIERDEGGIRIGCRAYDMGEGDIGILLVHGFADSPAVYHLMAPALAERGFACRAMRLPGFAADRETYADSDRGKWFHAVQNELATLRENHRHVWVVGHSTGASVGLKVLAEIPEVADGIVLLAPLIRVSDKRSPVLRVPTWFKIGEEIFESTEMLENVFPVDVHHPTDGYAGNDKFVPLGVYKEIFALMSDIEALAPMISHPVMMVLADGDQVIDSGIATTFYDAMSSSVKRRITQADTGHVIPLDHTWEAVTDDIASFVKTQSAMSSTSLQPRDP